MHPSNTLLNDAEDEIYFNPHKTVGKKAKRKEKIEEEDRNSNLYTLWRLQTN